MRNHSGRRGAALGIALLALVAGCSRGGSAVVAGTSDGGTSAVSGTPSDEPTLPPGGTSPPTTDRACRAALAPSTGPAAGAVRVVLADVRVSGPAVLGARTTLTVTSDGQRIVLQPSTSGLAILRGDTVVAWAHGAGAAVPLPLSAGATHPAQVVPATMPLVDCDGAPLAAGDYTVRAVVGYGGDPLQASADAVAPFALVSDPVAVTVP